MTDHTENTLRAAAKALTDVVRPALDPADPLASEQLSLVVEYIEFVRARLDSLYERERFELRQAIRTAEALCALDIPGGYLSALEAVRASAETDLAATGLPPAELRASAAATNEVIRDIIRRASADGDKATRDAIYRTVLDASESKTAFERSWYLPFGFDPEPKKVPPLDEVLAAERQFSGA